MGITIESNGPVVPARSLFIADVREGDIWKSLEWKKVMSGYLNGKTLLRIHNSSQKINKSISVSCGKKIVILVCFSKEMALPNPNILLKQPDASSLLFAYVMAVTDQRGHVYIFDFSKNKFWTVARTGVSASALHFNTVRRRELVVCLSDCSVHCYNIDTCVLIAKLPIFHNSPPNSVAIHPTKPLAMTTSSTESILWDTESWERLRVLTSQSGVQQTCFSSDGTCIIAAFNDGSIFFWTISSFSLLWKISLDQLSAPLTETSFLNSMNFTSPRTNYFTISESGEYFAYGGISSTLYIWNLFEKRLLHEILIPSFREKIIVQIQFIGNTNTVVMLSDIGDMIFIDVALAKFMGQIESKHQFQTFGLSPDGSVISTILMDSKHVLSMFRIDTFLQAEDDSKNSASSSIAETKQKSGIVHEEIPITKKTVVAEAPKTFYQLIESKSESSALNKSKLRRFLNYYGEYPAQYRTLIWRFLLKLPENRGGYEALLDQGTHPSFKDFRKRYPLKSDRVSRSMERILSSLAFWSPIFENLEYLPSLVFPFVKLYISDMFSCLEIIMTVLINWCQKWWEYYPNPPIEVLDIIEQLLTFHDAELVAHFQNCKVTGQVYAWIMMQTLFSEIFAKDDWLKLWDHLVSNQPSFLYFIIVAYLIRFRSPLLETHRESDFEFFFQRRNPVSLNSVIKLAYKLQNETPSTLSPASYVGAFTPCLRGEYPVFNKYPEFIVNYQSKMKDKIRKEEDEYIRKRRTVEELTRLTEELKKDKSAWDSADWKMNEMIEQWYF